MAVRGSNSLFFTTRIDNSNLKTGANEAQGIVQNMASVIGSINPFLAISGAAVTAFTLIASSAHKMVKELDKNMREVASISDEVANDYERTTKRIIDISKKTPASLTDLSKGLYQSISAGLNKDDSLKFLEQASKTSIAGLSTIEQSVDTLTTILNSYNLEVEESSRISDTLFNVVRLGKTTFSEIGDSISKVSALSASYGIDIEEIGAGLSVLTASGFKTSEAVTAIRSSIISLVDKMGAGVFQTMSFQDALKLSREEADKSGESYREFYGQVEAVNAVLGITNNFEKAQKHLKEIQNGAGATSKAYKILKNEASNQFKELSNKIKAATSGIGDAVLDMSTLVVRGLNNALESFDSLREETVKQKSEFNKLVRELEDVNTEFERKKEILGILKSSYPDYLKSLDIDKISNQNLSKALQLVKGDLEDINKLHERRIELSAYDDAVNVAQRKKDKVQRNYDGQLKAFGEELKKIEDYAADPKNGITLNYKFSDNPQDIFLSIEKSLGNNDYGASKTATLTRDLGYALQAVVDVKPKLEEVTKELEKQQKLAANKKLKVFSDEPNDVINALKKYKNLEKVSKSLGVDVTLIDNDKVKEEIGKIRQLDISINDLQNKFKNKEIPFLKELSKGLDKVKGEKEVDLLEPFDRLKRKDVKEFLNGFDKDYQEALVKKANNLLINPQTSETTRTPISNDTYKDQLKSKQEQYKLYESYVSVLGKEAAKKRFNELLKEGQNYASFLQNQLEIFKDNEAKKDVIVSEIKSAIKPRERVEALEPLTQRIIQPLIKPEIDTTSYHAVEREIQRLEKLAKKSQSKSEQKSLGEKIKIEKKKLKAIGDRIYGAEELENDFFTKIQTLARKDLVAEKKRLKAKQKLLDKNTKEGVESYEELQKQIAKINEEIGKDIAGVAQEFSKAFSGLSDLFQKFGDEDLSALFGQLSGVADGIASIASGDIIGGVTEVLSSALTVEVVSDTAKFEKAIKELEKAIDKLDYVISKSVGKDKVSSRKEAISDLEDLEKQAEQARNAETAARKQVKFLGVKLWKKGSGSGTDPAKLEELEQKAEDARRKAEELKEQLDQLYTGTTQATIVDGILAGLKEGKRGVADFADDFKELMQDALLQAFQIKYLEKEIEKFYDAFADAGSDSNYTAEEISALQNLYNTMISGAQDDIDAINSILEDSGIGALGSGDEVASGLAGAVSTITEDTANILAGTINSIKIDIATGLEIAQRNSIYLSQIVTNTSYNKLLEKIDISLSNIDSKLT